MAPASRRVSSQSCLRRRLRSAPLQSRSERCNNMSSRRQPIEYADASPEVRAVYDDIMATRRVDWINDFWKVLAHDPPTLRRVWANIKQVMAAGALDPLTKELVYIAVSVTNNCRYCIASHGASARNKGMT